jgi:hypothetical protein
VRRVRGPERGREADRPARARDEARLDRSQVPAHDLREAHAQAGLDADPVVQDAVGAAAGHHGLDPRRRQRRRRLHAPDRGRRRLRHEGRLARGGVWDLDQRLAGGAPADDERAVVDGDSVACRIDRLAVRPGERDLGSAAGSLDPDERVLRAARGQPEAVRPLQGSIDVLATAWNDNPARASVHLRPAPRRFVYARAHATARRAITLHLEVTPNARGRRLVRHHSYRVTLRLWVSYTPTGGRPRSTGFYGLHIPT